MVLALLALFFLSYSFSYAVSASPELVQQLKESGQLERLVERLVAARAKGSWSPSPKITDPKNPLGKVLNFDPSMPDTFRALVILVDFSDNPASGGMIFGEPSDFQHLLFSFDPGDGHYSMTEFYSENSYGTFFLEGQVVGWYRMPQTYAYYVDGQNGWGSYPQNAQKLAEDAVLAADPAVDYSQFDGDGNGWVDGLFVVHAGPGAEQTGSDNMIWSHMWYLHEVLNLDGVDISSYSMEPEEYMGLGLITMGVYAHEYGHVLGLPDLYDIDYSSAGVGDWSLMSGGSWNIQGRYPAFMDAWCKKEIGFLSPTNITANQIDVEIPTSYSNPVAFRLWQNGQVENQYFLIENRQKMGNDMGIDGSGLLIMHIDESIGGNWDENHPLVAIEQADGMFHLENNVNDGDAGDVWSAGMQKDFDDLSTPNTRKYSGAKTKTAVWNISSSDPMMYASFDINYSRPRFEIQSATFSDSAFGNNNGIAEEGESITFTFTVKNLWLDAMNVTGTLTCDNNDIVFDTPSVNIGAVTGEGGTGNNTSNPILFTIPVDFVTCIDSFYLEITSDNPYSAKTFGFELHIGNPSILIVDDDNGDSYEEYLEYELFARRRPFDVYDKSVSGSPSAALLNSYATVLWLTGDERTDILSAADVASMKSFLDNGGNLFLTGQSIVKELDSDDQSFLNNYLRASYVSDLLYPLMNGQPGSPIGDGIKIRYGGTTNQTDPQTIDTTNGSIANFVLTIGGITGLSYEGSYRLVLFSFGFEAISNDFVTQGYVGRDTVFARIMEFFDDDTVSLNPTVTFVDIVGESSNLNVVGHVPTFVWSVSDTTPNPIVQYEVEVGTGNLCHNHDNMWSPDLFIGSDTTLTYAGLPLEDGQFYLFSIRVNNGVTWSNWYEFLFRMNSVANPGGLVEPGEGQQLSTATPTLKVTNSADPEGDALTYEFEVYSDSMLATLVASATGIAEGSPHTSWTVDVPLAEDGQYFWRSRTFDGYEHAGYTAVGSFYVNADNQPPNSFSLLVPANDSIVLDLYPRLIWQTATDGDAGDSVSYALWTSLDSLFGTYTETANLADTFRTLTYLLDPDTICYWKVKAVDRSSAVRWSSETFHFFTAPSACCVGIRGNVDGDPGEEINIADMVHLVDYLFRGGPGPLCLAEGNVDGDPGEHINVADLTYLVDYLFRGGPPPPPCP